MIDLIQSLYACTIIRWDEWDGDNSVFEAIQHGRVIVADSLPLLIQELAPADANQRLAA